MRKEDMYSPCSVNWEILWSCWQVSGLIAAVIQHEQALIPELQYGYWADVWGLKGKPENPLFLGQARNHELDCLNQKLNIK